jgi:capsular polysaccharide biosynthesis protein
MWLARNNGSAPPGEPGNSTAKIRKLFGVGFRRLRKAWQRLTSGPAGTSPLRGFFHQAQDWVLGVEAQKTGASYKEIYPAQETRQKEPGTLDDEIPWEFARLLGGLCYRSRADFVVNIPDGEIRGSRGSVITPDQYLLVDISKEFRFHPEDYSVFSERRLPRLTAVPGTVAAMAVQGGNVYWHWMVDLLPRFHLLQRSGLEPGDVDRFIVNPVRSRFQRESLEALGIPSGKIQETGNGLHLRADRVVATSIPDDAPNAWVYDYLKEQFLKPERACATQGSDFLYLSRADAKTRGIVNEDQLVRELARFGFRSITLDGRSVSEQASLFSAAKVIVAPHGSALTNIAFCSPGTRVIEIFPPMRVNPLYWIVANQLGLDYYYFLGNGERMPAPGAGIDAQQWWWAQVRLGAAADTGQGTVVDVPKFLALLRSAQIV